MNAERNIRSDHNGFARSLRAIASLAFIFIAWNRVAAQNTTPAVLERCKDGTGTSVARGASDRHKYGHKFLARHRHQ